MAAIEQECKGSQHKLCLFHINENVGKHGRGLGEGVLAAVKGKFNAAAYAQTEAVGVVMQWLNVLVEFYPYGFVGRGALLTEVGNRLSNVRGLYGSRVLVASTVHHYSMQLLL